MMIPSMGPPGEAAMKLLKLCAMGMVLALPLLAQSADGLVAPSAEALWPQWQARVTVQSAAISPLSMSGLLRQLDTAAAPRAAQGGALLGDYYFAQPSFGSFRASGGLMVGSTGGAPLLTGLAAPSLGISLQSLAGAGTVGTESAGTVPYLGLGFVTAAWRNSLALTADLGWVAGQPSAIGGVGRALFGNQGWETALREIRLAPVVQLGVRYAF
jgi:hypothetical protein